MQTYNETSSERSHSLHQLNMSFMEQIEAADGHNNIVLGRIGRSIFFQRLVLWSKCIETFAAQLVRNTADLKTKKMKQKKTNNNFFFFGTLILCIKSMWLMERVTRNVTIAPTPYQVFQASGPPGTLWTPSNIDMNAIAQGRTLQGVVISVNKRNITKRTFLSKHQANCARTRNLVLPNEPKTQHAKGAVWCDKQQIIKNRFSSNLWHCVVKTNDEQCERVQKMSSE